MNNSQRVLVNTIAQYSRTIVNMVLSLYTVRLVLGALGSSDYGLYSLVAGIVAMLGFITNSLVSTTQRFVSYYQGKGNKEKLKEVFNNSLLIHLFLGIIVVVILECLTPILFNGFLNIPEGRDTAAVSVYQIVALILLVTFTTAPFRALLISHENIVYISIVDVLDSILRVILVLFMTIYQGNLLIFYGFIMLSVQLFDLFAISTYCFIRYEECVWPKLNRLNGAYIKELLAFAGWRTFGTACVTARDQGVSIIINRAFGTLLNAAWGIGLQLSGYSNFLTTAIVNSMAPQIVKAEGAGNRERTLWLSNVLSKMNFFLMSIIGIPFLFEINNILKLWLVTPPEKAALFSSFLIVALLFDSMTIGLTHVNNAIGKIGFYSVVMGLPRLITVIIIIILFQFTNSLYAIGLTYIAIEAMCAFVRIPLIGKQAGFKSLDFIKSVILREIFPMLICFAVCYSITFIFCFKWRFVLTFFISGIIYALAFYMMGLSVQEKTILNSLLQGILNRFHIVNH